jgi:FixJ family two-component response regulator
MRAIVHVVDDDVVVRDSLESPGASADWQPLSDDSAQQLLSHAGGDGQGTLVLDVNHRQMSPLELKQRLTVDGRGIYIIFTSDGCDVSSSVRAIKACAAGFLTKPIEDAALLAAIRGALFCGQSKLNTPDESRCAREAYASLTRRERQVMEGVVSGRLNKQVAWELGISEVTVKSHRGNVMRKMKATSFAHLVRLAAQLGIFASPGPERRRHLDDGDGARTLLTLSPNIAVLPTRS